MDPILSRDQLISSKLPLYPPPDVEEERRIAFKAQLNQSLKSIANGMSVYWHYRKENDKSIQYKYHFSPGAYKYKEEWLKPHLGSLIGPKDKAVQIIQEWLNAAFPGFKSIRVVERADWDYSIDVELGE